MKRIVERDIFNSGKSCENPFKEYANFGILDKRLIKIFPIKGAHQPVMSISEFKGLDLIIERCLIFNINLILKESLNDVIILPYSITLVRLFDFELLERGIILFH